MNIEEIVNKIDKPTKVIIQTMTEVKLNKKHRETKEPNKLSQVFKLQETLVEVNSDYEKKVNEARVDENKEANFESGSLKWGTCEDNKIVIKGDVKYLKVIELEKVSKANYVVSENDELVNIEYSDIVGYLPPASTSIKQNLDNEVKVRIYKLDSIIDMTIQDQ